MKLRFRSIGTALAYAYVLRVPLVIWLAVLALPIAAVPRGAPLGPLLRGLFDLSDPIEHGTHIDPFVVPAPNAPARQVAATEHVVEGSAFTLVTLVSLMLAASIGVTARLILRDGPARFDLAPIRMSPGIELALRLLVALPPIFVIAGAASQSVSTVAPLAAIAGTGVGLGVFVWALVPIQRSLWRGMFTPAGHKRPMTIATAPAHLALNVFTWIVSRTPSGFTNASNRLLSRHIFAVFQMLLSLALYWIVFILKLEPISRYIRIPTLCLVLMLAMVVVWGVTAISFLLDRFRIPVIVVLVAYGTAISIFPQGDHFFPSVPPDKSRKNVLPAEVLQRRAGHPAIAVAAMGGGIHAGAWVARVLAGLQQDSMRCGTDFDRSLSVISSVSGGSMGAMYIVDAYRDGRLQKKEDLDFAVKAAEGSSLDDVAWALTYPDLWWTVAPFLKGLWIDVKPLRVHLVSGPNLVLDRGTVLENSWKRTPSLATATLDSWRRDVAGGQRPAVIFNSTVVETGQRMLLGTTTIDGTSANGRVDFAADPEYSKSDVQVVTAARLSSTFPYVSPPARIQHNTVFDDQFHMVDGGYYDNYGTATLIEWLAKALENQTGRPSRVMLLGIRTFPAGGTPVADGRRGWIFETTHPLLTLATVRGAAQLSTADVTVKLLERAGQGYIVPLEFEFPDRAYQDLDDVAPPLSWHLTAGDRKRLRAAWRDPVLMKPRGAVQKFLRGENDFDTLPACLQ